MNNVLNISSDGRTLIEVLDKDIDVLDIPKNIVRIGDCACKDCTKLKRVNFNKKLKKIGRFAFENCKSLYSVVIPEQVNTLLPGIFKGCTELRCVVLPSIYKITDYMFQNCTNLLCIDAPYARIIGVSAFENCSFLVESSFSDEIIEIGKYAFKECSSLKKINITGYVESLGREAFYGCLNLEEIIGDCASIESKAFFNCEKLKNIDINPYSIKDYAFYNCKSLLKIRISSETNKLSNNIFKGCVSLKSINAVDSEFEQISKELLSDCINLEEFVIPRTCGGVQIQDGAFENMPNLRRILNSINISRIGEKAFRNCNSLEDIDLSNVGYIGESAFENCSSIKHFNWKCSDKEIPSKLLFGCTSLIEINISGKNVVSIGECAFKSCCNATNINIPSTITRIRESAFEGCASITKMEMYNLQYMYKCAFKNCSSLVSFSCGWQLNSIDEEAFSGCFNLKNVDANIYRISSKAFFDCVSLENINVYSVSTIESNSFENCKNLKELEFDEIEKVDNESFKNCIGLTNLSLGSNIKYIGTKILEGCDNLLYFYLCSKNPKQIELEDDAINYKNNIIYVEEGYAEQYIADSRFNNNIIKEEGDEIMHNATPEDINIINLLKRINECEWANINSYTLSYCINTPYSISFRFRIKSMRFFLFYSTSIDSDCKYRESVTFTHHMHREFTEESREYIKNILWDFLDENEKDFDDMQRFIRSYQDNHGIDIVYEILHNINKSLAN